MTAPDRELKTLAQQVVTRCRDLARVSDVAGETTRLFLSPATHAAHALVSGWMEAAGLTVAIDAIGNLRALTPFAAGDETGSRLMIGSHLDTVRNAGAFDGPLGVAMGIAVVEALAARGLEAALELVAFSEEEGVRFRQPFLGSLALIGEPVSIASKDENGITVGEALAHFGHKPTAPAILSPAVRAFFEIHIEQGPVLEAQNRPLAAVSAIAGQTRLRLRFDGAANHAGTTPMPLRRDALAAAAAWISKVEQVARRTPGLVATVGSLEVKPGIGNVVAGAAVASLDLRHADDVVRRTVLADLLDTAEQEAAARGVTCSVAPDGRLDQPAVPLDAELTALLVQSAHRCGFDAQPMVSGAGHDAMILTRRVPSTMLFVRTPGGVSHAPEEQVLIEDVEAALRVSVEFVQRYAHSLPWPLLRSAQTRARIGATRPCTI